jgi:Tol biopolymer transport system component
MKTSHLFKLFALLGILAIANPEPTQAQKPEEQFQKGLIKEEGEGALLEAIDIYNEVAEDESAERSLRAKALLHIGLCYEKLGKQEAEKTYQRIINQFPEQTETVKVASRKLSLLLQTESSRRTGDTELNIRKVWEGPDGLLGEPSPDGRYLSYVDWDTGDLAIYEIATGEKRCLTNKGSWEKSYEFAEYSRWSPDGRHIVYDWYNKNDFIDLCIIGLDGSEPRILYSNEEVAWIQTYDWSPDGKQILACFNYQDETNQTVLVSVADGSVNVLKTLADDFPDNMCFSKDGKYIVYDHPQKENSTNSDIFLLSTDGSSQISLVEHPANDFVFGWSPDGKSILFASDRDGTFSFYILKVTEGKAQGNPALVKSGIGSVEALGFTPDGSFYYGITQQRSDVYIAELDPETGKILSPPTKHITRFEGNNKEPDYSPDGEHLAYITVQHPYVSNVGSRFGGEVLVIRSLETGQGREIIPGLSHFGYPRWSPDGNSIIVVDWSTNNSMAYYQIDAQSGNMKTVLSPDEGMRLFGRHEWSLDGRSFYYGRIGEDRQISQIMVRELESGTEKVIYQSKPSVEQLSMSPDGHWLAILNSGDAGFLSIIPAAGGEPRELFRYAVEEKIRIGTTASITWSIDGKYILFSMWDANDDDPKWELCRILAEGGEIEKLGLTVRGRGVTNLNIHPDGRHISFSSNSETLPPAVWVMENFLPSEITAIKQGKND